jgi:hypothetical protein
VLRRVASSGRRLVSSLRLRRDRLGVAAHAALVLAGTAAGLLLALPVDDVSARCPPRGEGYQLCYLQKGLLPTVLIVLAGLLLGHLVSRQLLVRLPAWRRRVREVGERRVGMEETREEPPYRQDPFLLASTWGVKQGRSERRRFSLLARLRRR